MKKLALTLTMIFSCVLSVFSVNVFAFSLLHDLPYARPNGVTYTEVMATRDSTHTYYAYYDIPVNGSIPDIIRWGFDWGIAFGCNSPYCTSPGYHLYMITCDQNNSNCTDGYDTGTGTEIVGSGLLAPTCWNDSYLKTSRNFMWHGNYYGLCGVGDVTYGTYFSANYVPQQLTITLSPQAGGSVTSDPTGLSCSDNTCQGNFYGDVSLTATASTGWAFAHWDNGTTNLYSNPLTVTMNSAKTLTAKFFKTFRCAVGDFHQTSGYYGECVLYVRYETGIPWADFNGEADTTFQQAIDNGYATGSEPRESAIVVFDRFSIPDVGHVGIVTYINGNDIWIQDSNWNLDGYVHNHEMQDITQYSIKGYIYCTP
jgi:surface antigen